MKEIKQQNKEIVTLCSLIGRLHEDVHTPQIDLQG